MNLPMSVGRTHSGAQIFDACDGEPRDGREPQSRTKQIARSFLHHVIASLSAHLMTDFSRISLLLGKVGSHQVERREECVE